jgi:TolB-like protein/tetratricopeptide (TPR) repeat protein
MTEEITSRLAVVPELGVISRTSALQYAARDKTTRQIGDELGVDYVLEGTVRWAPGERVRITPQLIRVADDTHLWAEAYDRALDSTSDIFAIQTDIAERVSGALDLSVRGTKTASSQTVPTRSMEAYDAYLRGLAARNALGMPEEPYRLAVQMFELAVQHDPAFALGWAELGEARVNLFLIYERRASLLEAAGAALDRARELGPELPQTRRALGAYHLARGETDLALRELEVAAERLPGESSILVNMGVVRTARGELDEAAVIYWRYEVALHLGRHQEALALVDLLPSHSAVFDGVYSNDYLRAQVYASMGEAALAASSYESARTALHRILEEQPDNENIECNLGLVYTGLGRKVDALLHGRRAAELKPLAKDRGVAGPYTHVCLARIHAELGEPDAALDLLEQILSIPTFYSVVWLEGEPCFASLRDHPRYRSLVRKYG